MAKQEERRDELIRLISAKERSLAIPASRISNQQIDQFATGLCNMIQDGPVAFRKEYMGLFVSRVDVGGQEIRISGPQAALAAAIAAKKTGETGVPCFVQEWRARQDWVAALPDLRAWRRCDSEQGSNIPEPAIAKGCRWNPISKAGRGG
jgi:hypothetical protein